MRVGLSVYGTVYGMGLHPKAKRQIITPIELMEMALDMSLTGVEFPAQWLNDENIDSVKAFANSRQMFINLDTGGYDPAKLANVLNLAARIGAETVRTVVGGADFGGDRRLLSGRWNSFMEDVLVGLAEASVVAEQLKVNLAVENHQDLASEELIWLCERIDSNYFGINLDTGNPLATAEEPIAFFESVQPYLKNVHLKDYAVYLSEEGYRLVRCPLGQGVIDFPALFEILNNHHPGVTMVIELGALEARHTRLLADDFWPDYPPRPARQLARVWRFARDHARPTGDWRTPYERGDSADAIVSYEKHQLVASLAYLECLGSCDLIRRQ